MVPVTRVVMARRLRQCRFCCSIANWFCWGSTHFCDKCHHQQMIGNNIARMKVKDLPKCKGELCPLWIKHPPNGQEYTLGCALCRRAEPPF